MKRSILVLLLCLSLVSACGPSPEAIATQTATAATAIAASWTKTPTPTPLPSATPTPAEPFRVEGGAIQQLMPDGSYQSIETLGDYLDYKIENGIPVAYYHPDQKKLRVFSENSKFIYENGQWILSAPLVLIRPQEKLIHLAQNMKITSYPKEPTAVNPDV